ncbi:MAG: stage II sporulation protein R [Thermanaeromonas sp.]|uniref:stage II sporulation protein R n=1 Tax=Thermanaeromonas sp. TaxID=2003697 RepID=UPI00243A0C55|nr:stage II sporulation protein R [Thermanaeromonas sp.]MCG0276975.1 stage II sporulation protein R [Thermanaeromonas sp.]
MKALKGQFLLWCLTVTMLVALTAAIFLKPKTPAVLNVPLQPDNLIRLHVIANSDTPEDQNLKLKVRDAIIKKAGEELAKAREPEEARKWLAENLPGLVWVAQQELKKEGYTYSVRAQVGDFNFPTRSYRELVLPAGRYEALRLIIGEGKGENWWCVLFPPLCLVDVAEGETSREVVAWPEEGSLETSIELRFKILEVLRASTQRLASLWWW